MTDVDGQADMASQDTTVAAQATEQTPDGAADEPPADQHETPEAPDTDDAKKETSRERRDREKALKARLREAADHAIAAADAAEARRRSIVEAGASATAPQERDFTDPLDYVAAKAVWSADQNRNKRDIAAADAEAKEAKGRADSAAQAEERQAQNDWLAQIAEARTRYADFDKVALDGRVPITNEVASLLMGTELAADVAYYLGSNPDEAHAISRMPVAQAAREIGRIEARIEARQKRTPPETKAPPPISPVRGTASPARNPDTMSMEDYVAARRSGKIR